MTQEIQDLDLDPEGPMACEDCNKDLYRFSERMTFREKGAHSQLILCEDCQQKRINEGCEEDE